MAEETRCTGVSDHVTWMEYVQRLEVVVDGVAHDHFSLKYTEDLQDRSHASAEDNKDENYWL